MQALHAIRALIERRFRLPPAPAFFHGATIFSAPKLTAQSLRSAFAGKSPNGDTCDHYHGYSDDNAYLRVAYF
jgi:hypothetical protein